MNPLVRLLEGIEDGHEVAVEFESGDCFGLCDFEMVDESIYERADICVADIVTKIRVSKDVYKVGNKLEFSINDIVGIKELVTGEIIWLSSDQI